MKSRLRELDADAVCVLARNKDKTHRYRATSDGLAALNDHLIPSGASAMREESIAGTFGMAGGSGTAEGYVMIGDVSALADAFGLVGDPDGNAIIHEVDLHEPFAYGRAPVAAIAVDLMDSLATRERSADNASSTNSFMSEPEQSSLMLCLVPVCAGGSGVTTWRATATL